MRPELLVFDLDGTLLDRSLRVSDLDVAGARRAREAGLRVGVATGRMYRSGLPHALRLGADLPLICYQGALIKEMAPSTDEEEMARARVLSQDPVPGELGLEVLRTCRERGWALNVYQEDRLFVEEITDDIRFYTEIAQVEAEVARDPSLEERVRRGSTKLTAVVKDEARFREALGELKRRIGDRAEVTRSLVGFCEITAPGVNKGRALRRLCDHLRVDPVRVLAVGDAPNDLPLLAAAGTRVAVESAAEEVRRAADWVVPGPGDGGLAEVVRRVLQTPASAA